VFCLSRPSDDDNWPLPSALRVPKHALYFRPVVGSSLWCNLDFLLLWLPDRNISL
jgi:hypothetical protein